MRGSEFEVCLENARRNDPDLDTCITIGTVSHALLYSIYFIMTILIVYSIVIIATSTCMQDVPIQVTN